MNKRIKRHCIWGDQPQVARDKQEDHRANQMPKPQLVAALAEETGTDKKAVGAMLDVLTGTITRTVAAGGAVTLPGVGKIACRERPERMARNPATGDQIKKDADRVVKMTVAKALKDTINA